MKLVCPKCLSESDITLDVNDGDTLHCPECDEDYSVLDVQTMVEGWVKLLPWLKSHPARQPEAASTGGTP